jgi:hypothetical protein
MGIQWRGTEELFSNVFHYNSDVGDPNEATHVSLANAIVGIMRPLYVSKVSFKTYRVWGPTNATPAESQTRALGDLTGLGTAGWNSFTPAEETVYGSLYLGRNPATGRKRFLRKYLHTAGIPNTEPFDAFLGHTALSTSFKNTIAAALLNLNQITVGGVPYYLCAPSGSRPASSEVWKIGNHLHIRQFHQ